MRTTVVFVEDRDTTLESLVFLLSTSNNVEVVGGLRTAAEALERIPELAPDVALVDLGLPDLPGIELIRPRHFFCKKPPAPSSYAEEETPLTAPGGAFCFHETKYTQVWRERQ